MRLTNYTDFSLRVLIYLASQQKESLVTIQEIADCYRISKNHLMKVVYELGKKGYLENSRGRNGGMRLAQQPETIKIGTVVREMEEDFYIVECFNADENKCILSPACRLKGILQEALHAYCAVLDQYTLADVIGNREDIRQLLFPTQ